MHQVARILLFLIIGFEASGQSAIRFLTEELPKDTIHNWTIQDHSSVWPQLKHNVSFKDQKDTTNKSCHIIPLVDLHYRTLKSDQFRTGSGIALEYQKHPKFYGRLIALGGIGQGDSLLRSKAYFLDTTGSRFSYLDLRSRLSYSPNHVFNFQAGIDQHFIGEGNRSLFLSDYGRPYPFASIRTSFWRLQYFMLYQFMGEREFATWKNKFGATHHISYNPFKWLTLGVFETVIFQPKDTLLNRGFDLQYINPVIFYRPQEYALGSSDNVLLGASLTLRYKQHALYGQLILDEFSLPDIKAKTGWWANKYGLQVGLKGHFKKHEHHFFYRMEFNAVRPYTYAHLSSGQNYGNLGMPLAHPLGANFYEYIAEFKTQKEKLLVKGMICYFLHGENKNGFNYGGNVYLPYINRPYEYGHYTGQGVGNNGFRGTVTAQYTLKESYQLICFAEAQLRYDSYSNTTLRGFTLGLRSNLFNDYRTF
jgi:hypothetical protein